jgi:hypothetical protein
MPEKLAKVLLRGFAVWLVIILAETLHGTARELFLKPLLGDARARQISFFTALLLILTITFLFIRWIRAVNIFQLFAVGLMWAGLTFCFEMLLARFVMNISWEKFFSDYNIFAGGLMAIGLLFLIFVPLIAAKSRKIRL